MEPDQLTLVVPGLFRDPPIGEGSSPALDVLASRGRCLRDDAGGVDASLLELFGCECPSGCPAPVAPVAYLGDTGGRPESWVVRADPVHLHPRRHELILMAGEDFFPNRAEANQLIAELIAAGSGAGHRWTAPHPRRWYLSVDGDPKVSFHSFDQALGMDIDPLLPFGADATIWHRILNEVQMVLHHSKVNELRDEQGRPAINSVWLWGGGRLPPQPPQRWRGVWANDPVTRGLARLSQTPLESTPEQAAPILTGHEVRTPSLVVLGDFWQAVALHEPVAMARFVESFDRQWMTPILDAMREGRIGAARILDPGVAEVGVRARELRRWWRRIRPYGRVLAGLEAQS